MTATPAMASSTAPTKAPTMNPMPGARPRRMNGDTRMRMAPTTISAMLTPAVGRATTAPTTIMAMPPPKKSRKPSRVTVMMPRPDTSPAPKAKKPAARPPKRPTPRIGRAGTRKAPRATTTPATRPRATPASGLSGARKSPTVRRTRVMSLVQGSLMRRALMGVWMALPISGIAPRVSWIPFQKPSNWSPMTLSPDLPALSAFLSLLASSPFLVRDPTMEGRRMLCAPAGCSTSRPTRARLSAINFSTSEEDGRRGLAGASGAWRSTAGISRVIPARAGDCSAGDWAALAAPAPRPRAAARHTRPAAIRVFTLVS